MPKISELNEKTTAIDPYDDYLLVVDNDAVPPQTKRINLSTLIMSHSIGIYPIELSINGMPDGGLVIHKLLLFDVLLKENFIGSLYYNEVNPTAEVEISIQQDGVEFGTLTIGTDGTPTWACAVTNITAGEKLSFVFPAIQDDTWSGVTLTLNGYIY